jgi:gliding motility-associated-like protein
VVIGSDNKALYVPGDNFWGRDTFFYRICNANGCDTAMVVINVTSGDSIYVYTGFSPNGDGMNDRWQMRGIENFPDNQLIIYNRWGVEIFNKEKYTNDGGWDGTWNGRFVPDGTYFYVLFLDASKQTRKTGYIQIHR